MWYMVQARAHDQRAMSRYSDNFGKALSTGGGDVTPQQQPANWSGDVTPQQQPAKVIEYKAKIDRSNQSIKKAKIGLRRLTESRQSQHDHFKELRGR
jgi:hypothetical protein